MNECVPCWTIVTTISGLVTLTVINSVVLCVLCVRLKTTRKRLRKAMEMESPKKETPERGLTTAATKRENPRASARHREKVSYTIHPTKKNSQVYTTPPHLHFINLPYYCRHPETDHLRIPCNDRRN